MAFHALADYQNHVIGWLQWEQSSLGDGAVVRFPRIWMSSGECRVSLLCRGLILAKIGKEAVVIVRLPYSETLYLWSTDGRTYSR